MHLRRACRESAGNRNQHRDHISELERRGEERRRGINARRSGSLGNLDETFRDPDQFAGFGSTSPNAQRIMSEQLEAIRDSLENLFNDEDDEVEMDIEDIVQPVVQEHGEVLPQGGQVEQPEQLAQREDAEEAGPEVHDQSIEGEQGGQGSQQVREGLDRQIFNYAPGDG